MPFLSRYADMQVYCEQMLGLDGKEQLGLSRAAELAGVDDGQLDHHRALDDSVLSALVLKKLYTRESFRPHVQDCTDPEFYRRITFKTNYICDPESPLIERQHLRFTCEKCGGEAKRRGKWSVKNKSLRATFRCARCGWEFCGQVRVKQKYEGITVTKKTIPLPKIEKPKFRFKNLPNYVLIELWLAADVFRYIHYYNLRRISLANGGLPPLVRRQAYERAHRPAA